MLSRNTVLALMFAGSTAFAGLARAETAAAVPADTAHKVVALADEKEVKKVTVKHEVSEAEYIQDLREARTHLNEAKSAFDADLPERDNRHDILEGIDKAIDAIDTEIKSLEDKMKK